MVKMAVFSHGIGNRSRTSKDESQALDGAKQKKQGKNIGYRPRREVTYGLPSHGDMPPEDEAVECMQSAAWRRKHEEGSYDVRWRRTGCVPHPRWDVGR